MSLRKRFYVDPELQFPIILALIVLVTGQGVFVGWAFGRLVSLARGWDQPDQVARFFWTLASTLVPVVVFNFAIGVWLSHKIAGPLHRIRRAVTEITRGNLEVEVSERSGDLLGAHVHDTARMVETLRRLIYRDHGFAIEADEYLSKIRDWGAKRGLPESAKKELQELLDGAKSRLSIINAHFMKGKTEGPQQEEI
jgi:methyl-accepting chemotaxis protein